jgi:WD40 repeat protein
VVNARRLTTDDYGNDPLAWTPDSRQVIFTSLRREVWQIYRQALDGRPSQIITTAPTMNFELARVAPDGAWLVVEGGSPGTTKQGLYRVAIGGGVPQLLFEVDRFVNFRCTDQRGNRCVYALRAEDQKNLIITSFDPTGGKSRQELIRIPVEPEVDYDWTISPDGSQICILKSVWNENQLRFVQVHSGQSRTVAIKDYVNLRSLDWAPDSKALFIGSAGPGGARLLHVDLNGYVQSIWQQPQLSYTWGLPSPDGRHLAMLGVSRDANVWIIDNF